MGGALCNLILTAFIIGIIKPATYQYYKNAVRNRNSYNSEWISTEANITDVKSANITRYIDEGKYCVPNGYPRCQTLIDSQQTGYCYYVIDGYRHRCHHRRCVSQIGNHCDKWINTYSGSEVIAKTDSYIILGLTYFSQNEVVNNTLFLLCHDWNECQMDQKKYLNGSQIWIHWNQDNNNSISAGQNFPPYELHRVDNLILGFLLTIAFSFDAIIILILVIGVIYYANIIYITQSTSSTVGDPPILPDEGGGGAPASPPPPPAEA